MDGEQNFLAHIIEPIVHWPPAVACFKNSLKRLIESGEFETPDWNRLTD